MSKEIEAILNGQKNARIMSRDEHDKGQQLNQRFLWSVGAMLDSEHFNTWTMTVKQQELWQRVRLAFYEYNAWLRKGSEFNGPIH